MEIERAIILGVVILAAFSLGFISGRVYARKKLMRRIKILENFKQAVKALCPKIQNGETELADYLPGKVNPPKPWPPPPKENDDTKTGEMVRITKGHPKDA